MTINTDGLVDIVCGVSTVSGMSETINAQNEVAQQVVNKIGTDDEIIKAEAIHLAGLPQTAGAPAGYGDLASAISVIAGNDKVMSLYPLQHQDFITMDDKDGVIYGRKSSDMRVYQSSIELTDATPIGNNLPSDGPGPRSLRFVKALGDGVFLASVEDGSAIFRMYKTSDNCQTWTLVFTADTVLVRPISNRTWLDAVVNNQRVIFYAEYNVNPSADGTNAESKLEIWKSLDVGSTWQRVTTFNTGVVNNTRHIHAIRQFYPNGTVFVCFGDGDDQAAIVCWDGSTTWPINTSWSNLNLLDGFTVFHGSGKYVAVDLVESDGRVWYLADKHYDRRGDMDVCGIHSFDYVNLNDHRFEAAPTSMTAEIAGWFGCKDSQGRIHFICSPDTTAPAGNKFVGIVSSNKSKTEWVMNGRFNLLGTATVCLPLGFGIIDDKMYLSADSGSGKTFDNSVTFESSATNEARVSFETAHIADVIHPVFWVSQATGSDANNGYNRSSAFADFRYAITGDRVAYGSAVMIMDEVFTFTGATSVVWKSNAVNVSKQGESTLPVTIRGYGASRTKLLYDAAGTATSVYSVSTANRALAAFSDITIESDKVTRLFDLNQSSGQTNQLTFIRCQVGNPMKPVSSTVRCDRGLLSVYSSVLSASKDGHCLNTAATAAQPTNIKLDNSLITSCLNAFEITNTSTDNVLFLYNTKVYGWSGRGINLSGASAFIAGGFGGWDNEFSTTLATNVGAVVGGGTFANKLQNTTVRGTVNNATAFADSCKLGLYTKYDFKYSDYID